MVIRLICVRTCLLPVDDRLPPPRPLAGEVPGASPKDCGNYLDMNLSMANYWGRKYAALLENIDDSRLVYPE